jgi:hypothetical protein
VMHQVFELTGALLDAAVAMAEGVEKFYTADCFECSPSQDWECGGPIIERAGISLHFVPSNGPDHPAFCGASLCDETKRLDDHEGGTMPAHYFDYAPTPLIAAMRVYVAAKFGREVELP